MKKYLLSAAVLMMSAATFTSCLSSSSDDQTQTYTYGGNDCFNVVRNRSTGDVYIGNNPNYKFKYNLSDGNVEITLSDVTLSQGSSGLAFKLPTLPFKPDNTDGFIVTTGSNLVPENTGQTVSYMFDSFTLRSYPGRRPPVYNIRYLLSNGGNTYEVTTYCINNVYYGPTSATNLDPNATNPNYTNAGQAVALVEAYYQIILDPKTNTANLALGNAKFSSGMVPQTLLIKNIPFTLTSDGFTMSTTSGEEYDVYTNTSGNQAAPDLKLSDISVVATLKHGANIRFKANMGDDGKYDVTAALRYLLYNTSSSDNGN